MSLLPFGDQSWEPPPPGISPTRAERVLAFSILVGVLGIFALLFNEFVLQPQWSASERLQAAHKSYVSNKRAELRKAALSERISKMETSIQNDRSLVMNHETFDLAAAMLQRRVKKVVQLHDPEQDSCLIQRQENIPESSAAEYIKVTVNVTLLCRLEDLQPVIYDLESTKPSLVMNNVTIATAGGERPDLRVQFDIFGFIDNYDLAGEQM